MQGPQRGIHAHHANRDGGEQVELGPRVGRDEVLELVAQVLDGRHARVGAPRIPQAVLRQRLAEHLVERRACARRLRRSAVARPAAFASIYRSLLDRYTGISNTGISVRNFPLPTSHISIQFFNMAQPLLNFVSRAMLQ